MANRPVVRTFMIRNLKGMKEIILSGFQTEIFSGEFFGCKDLESITMYRPVSIIRNIAFSGCSSLKSISFPDGLKTVEPAAFDGCSALESVSLPDTVISVDYNLFSGCTRLAYFRIPAGIRYLSSGVFSGSSLRELVIPGSLIDAGMGVGDMPKLETLILEDGTKAISRVSNCPCLKRAVFSPSISQIGNRLFDQCGSLLNVWIYQSEATFGSDCGIPEKAVIHGYAGSTAEQYAQKKDLTFVPIEGSFEDAEYRSSMEE